jgi:hypothetical protein
VKDTLDELEPSGILVTFTVAVATSDPVEAMTEVAKRIRGLVISEIAIQPRYRQDEPWERP